jgi:hypothetical protein
VQPSLESRSSNCARHCHGIDAFPFLGSEALVEFLGVLVFSDPRLGVITDELI